VVTRPNNGDRLSAAHHEFARWGAGASISFWAFGAQMLHDPWNKFAAILSPGIGYSVGKLLDLLIHNVSEQQLKKERQKSLSDNNITLDQLYIQRNDAITFGADPKIIASIDAVILEIQQRNISIVASSVKVQKKTTTQKGAK
jgi:hypothetical protein